MLYNILPTPPNLRKEFPQGMRESKEHTRIPSWLAFRVYSFCLGADGLWKKLDIFHESAIVAAWR
jgi:hypothetical protein